MATEKNESSVLHDVLLDDYPEVFHRNINTTNFNNNINHHIITSGPPVRSSLRHLSPEKLTFVKGEIAQLLQDGIITPSSSPYASSIHFVPKAQPGTFEWSETIER